MSLTIAMSDAISALDAHIAELESRKQALIAEAQKPWPKRVTIHAATNKDAAYVAGEQLGLTGEALRYFAQGAQVAMTYDVQEDGTCTLVSLRCV